MAQCAFTGNRMVVGSNPGISESFDLVKPPMPRLGYRNVVWCVNLSMDLSTKKNTCVYAKRPRDCLPIAGLYLSTSHHHHFIAVNLP